MPILQPFTLPKTAADLAIPASTNAFFVAFLASKDPSTKKPWCPDVVAALPTLESTFTGAKKPQAAFVEVGQRPEWRDPKNVFRTTWNVNNVPALVRYERVDGVTKEVGRLIEGEILDGEKLGGLVEA
ncbi:hypothetical protein Q7P36_009615 [Cladosporium allicinum]